MTLEREVSVMSDMEMDFINAFRQLDDGQKFWVEVLLLTALLDSESFLSLIQEEDGNKQEDDIHAPFLDQFHD